MLVGTLTRLVLAAVLSTVPLGAGGFAQEAKIPSVVETLQSKRTLAYVRDNLEGRVEVTFHAGHLWSSSVEFAGLLLSQAARGCGLQLKYETTAEASRYVWFVPVEGRTQEAITSAVASLDSQGYSFSVDRSDLIKSTLPKLIRNGISLFDVFSPDSGSKQTLTLVFIDRAGLEGADGEAAQIFVALDGIAGLEPQATPIDENRFSYFFGGGTFGEMAGPNADRYSRLCKATMLIKAICLNDLNRDIPAFLNSVHDGCDRAETIESFKDLERSMHELANGSRS